MERIVNWFNENFLLASLFWGSIAFGYLIYGWKQKIADAVYRRPGDDRGVIPHQQCIADVTGLHGGNGNCLLAGQTRLLIRHCK